MNIAKGDRVRALGMEFEVDRVLHSEYWDRYGWDVEFIDTHGRYHHWKQEEDGGELLKTMPNHIKIGEFEGGVYYFRGKRKLVNCQGTDCTDLFRKFGYNV